MNVSFNVLAERELNDAAQYWELENPGLGAAFLAEVEKCCEAIVARLRLVIMYSDQFGVRLARRFPYAVLYSRVIPTSCSAWACRSDGFFSTWKDAN